MQLEIMMDTYKVVRPVFFLIPGNDQKLHNVRFYDVIRESIPAKSADEAIEIAKELGVVSPIVELVG